MKAGIICFTEHGVLLAEQLINGLLLTEFYVRHGLRRKNTGQRCLWR